MPRRKEKEKSPKLNCSSPRRMILRSGCRGECNHSLSDSPRCSPSNSVNFHRHSHSHSHPVHEDRNKKIDCHSELHMSNTVENNKTDEHRRVISASNFSSGVVKKTVYNFRAQSEKITTVNFKHDSSSQTVKIGGNSKSLTEDSEFTFSQPKTLYSLNTALSNSSSAVDANSVKRQLWRRSKYSDYSSGDEFDFEDQKKTDYTYASSSSYYSSSSSIDSVPPPNMSRVRLRGAGTPYPMKNSVADYFNESSSHTKMVNHVNFGRNSYQSTPTYSAMTGSNGKDFSYLNRKGLTYGLDYESDDDVDVEIERRQIYMHQQKRSVIKMIFDIVECVFPISTIWEKFWSFVYWVICSVLLLDTWTLSRKIVSKLWMLLPLFLILLILGGLLSEENGINTSEVFRYLSAPVSLVATYFTSITQSNNHLPLPSVIVAGSVKNNDLVDASPTAGLSHDEVESIVRTIVNNEMIKYTSQVKNDEVENKQDLFQMHDEQLISLQKQMKDFSTQSWKFYDELKLIREKMAEAKSDQPENLHRLHGLEMQLESLKTNINLMQETQTSLLAKMRNCCRNHTDDPVAIENQMAAMLLRMMDEKQSSSSLSKALNDFNNWLKKSFVTQSDMSAELTSTANKLSQDIEHELTQKAEAVARLAAAAAVRDTLRQHESRMGMRGEISSSSTLSEDEVRKIVRDAILLYDADKTGQTDYALESAGGSVISTRCSENYQMGTRQMSLFGIPFWSQPRSPRTVIQPGVHPGECWAFKGSEGYLVIQLTGLVRPTAFSIEHIPLSIAPDGNIDSALKDFSVWGLHDEKIFEGTEIGRYTYDINGEPLQYFPVADPDIEPFPIVELRIHSNHGNMDYTCLYRFRVHGKLVKR